MLLTQNKQDEHNTKHDKEQTQLFIEPKHNTKINNHMKQNMILK